MNLIKYSFRSTNKQYIKLLEIKENYGFPFFVYKMSVSINSFKNKTIKLAENTKK